MAAPTENKLAERAGRVVSAGVQRAETSSPAPAAPSRASGGAGGQGTRRARSKRSPRPTDEATVKITVEMGRSQHLAVKRWVLEEDTTIRAVVLALLAELEEDAALAERVRGRL